ncbi:MAG: glycogen synthase [Verrucomicrobiaceae bacterium]|nr:MAG: glycogen synthase [Verrucomicrobiaceae bacterium]
MSSLAHSPSAPPPVHATKPRSRAGSRNRRPRILLVTPELSESRFLARNGKPGPCVKAGGLADVSAALFDSLSEAGADVHVAMPHFRSLYQPGPNGQSRRLHLCQDREFSYRRSVYDGCNHANLRGALAFQRDVIHYVMPRLRPDLVHCHDWMTGLVPAAARTMGIPSLFTLHNQHDECVGLGQIEDRGVDAGRFWEKLYFNNYPGCYEEARRDNSVSMLASGILAADEMNTVSRSFLAELASGGGSTPWQVTDAVRGKLACGRGHGIINSPPASISPDRDVHLAERYDPASHVPGKLANKRALQQRLGLELDDEAPILFWPSRLDPAQKGCQLLAEIIYKLVSDYWALGLQVVFVADGPYHDVFRNIASFHQMGHRIAVCGFDEGLSRLGYAASDYILMPSAYEPCGLAQMVGLRYGSLPIVHSTGGLRDTVTHLDPRWGTGNGFVFDYHDAQGLRWAVDEAIRFHIRPAAEREANVSRIMKEAAGLYSPESMVRHYLEIYKRLLQLH